MNATEATALGQELYVFAAVQAITTADDGDAQEWADKLERVARHMSSAEIAEADQRVETILRSMD